jgi:predicted GIY-YIG superfamily endonuclease
LPLLNEEHIDFKNTKLVKNIFNHTSYNLVKVWRFDNDVLLQDAYNARDGQPIKYENYGRDETDLALCYTNDAVNAINKKWNKHHASKTKIKKEVGGFDNTKYILYKGLKLLAYKTHGKLLFTNSQELVVESWTDDKLFLVDEKDNKIILEIKYTASFKPAYAMTVHKSQGTTLRRAYSIYEHKLMTPSMLYVALTRTSNKEHVNFCEIDDYRPYIGYIYSYEYNGKHYIGSTKDLTKRKQEHKMCEKAGDTKFNKTIKKHGFDKFEYQVLETLRYNNIKELWKLEDSYIEKYDSINNGYNIRYNTEKRFS